jgi:hypothetical protein
MFHITMDMSESQTPYDTEHTLVYLSKTLLYNILLFNNQYTMLI